jgi:hypothetical protein
MRVVGFSYRADEPLLTHPVEIYGAPDNRYDGDAMKAVDEEGSLELYQKGDEHHFRAWCSSRPTKSSQVFSFEAFPREVTRIPPPPGGRTDLRRDLEGGMTGAGISFIPLPPRRRTLK